MRKKVIIISTGGTIAMRFDEEKGGMVPAITGQELVAAVPALQKVCDIEVVDFANIPSVQIAPKHMQQIAELAQAQLAKPEVAGVVITHGTDTVEETAYFIDLYTHQSKPICLTAAMRTSGEESSDGPVNILSAVRVAADAQAQNCGVMVVMNNEIHAARDVTKTHTANVKTFASPFWGPIGYVDSDQIIMHHIPRRQEQIHAQHVNAVVPILKAYTGIEPAWIDALLSQPLDGLVIEGFGRGNFPPSFIAPVEKLIAKGVPVVVTTRVWGGRVLDIYAAMGAGGDMQKRGAILAGEISSQKARLKLILALGADKNMSQIKSLFTSPSSC